MKNKLTKISLGVLLTLSGASFAQTVDVFNAEVFTPTSIQPQLEATNAVPPGGGNVFERDVTPQLREMSRKKSVLDLKKLDLEIEKVDLEIHKIQQERIGRVRSNSSNQRIIDPTNINNPVVTPDPALGFDDRGSMHNAAPPPTPTRNAINDLVKNLNLEEPEDVYVPKSNHGIYVLMTYGFDNDLYAKITSGNQGGFVVRKGDILPNGKTVTKVTAHYIEVLDKEHKKAKKEKIFVTGAPDKDSLNSLAVGAVAPGQSFSGSQGSDAIGKNIGDAMGALSLPGNLSSSFTSEPPPPPVSVGQMPVTPFTGM